MIVIGALKHFVAGFLMAKTLKCGNETRNHSICGRGRIEITFRLLE